MTSYCGSTNDPDDDPWADVRELLQRERGKSLQDDVALAIRLANHVPDLLDAVDRLTLERRLVVEAKV
jgi:hypothetical protein